MALRLAIDMKLFDAAAELTREENEKQFSVEELAAKTKADELLISKCLTSQLRLHNTTQLLSELLCDL